MPLDLHPLWLSLVVALCALALALPPGVGLARFMSGRRGIAAATLESLFLLPLVLPPVVSGLFLLWLLGRRGPFGLSSVLFTPFAAVLAAAIVAFPLVYTSARAAFEATAGELELVGRALGASPLRAFWTITFPLALPGLVAGAILGFARALGEFGATVMVAGNVPDFTLTAPVAIYFAAEDGDLNRAGVYALLLSAANLFFVFLAHQRRRRFS